MNETDFSQALIWTSKGNMLESDLDFSTAWEDTPTYTKLTETWRERATGEIVKQSAHALSKMGVMGDGVASSFG
jgi:hypothetical protein